MTETEALALLTAAGWTCIAPVDPAKAVPAAVVGQVGHQMAVDRVGDVPALGDQHDIVPITLFDELLKLLVVLGELFGLPCGSD